MYLIIKFPTSSQNRDIGLNKEILKNKGYKNLKMFWIKSHQWTTLPVWQSVEQRMSYPRDLKTLWKSGEEREVPNEGKDHQQQALSSAEGNCIYLSSITNINQVLGWYNNKDFKHIPSVEWDFTHVVETLHLRTQSILHHHIHAVYNNIYLIVWNQEAVQCHFLI